MDIHLLVKFFITMMAIMNPLGGVAIFISLTESFTEKQRQKEALSTALSVIIILLVVTWIGTWILNLFSIDIASFRTAGGLIILMMGLQMLQSKNSPVHHTQEEQNLAKKRDSIATIPMAMPMVAGPGAICTIIVYNHDLNGWAGSAAMSMIDIIIAILIAILLYFSGFIGRLLGESGTKIVTRMMGLILSAMAMDMIFAGISTALPGLA